MVGEYEQFRHLGAGVVALAMSPPAGLARFVAAHAIPFPMVTDPDRRVYSALGLQRTSWGRILRPGIIWKYLKMIAHGGKIRRIPEGEDPLQLGGDFLFDSAGRLLWSYRSDNPTDRPSVARLLELVRERVVES